MKKLLVTIATPNVLPFFKEMIDTHRHYADKQKFEFRLVTELYWKDLHPSFSKVWELQRGIDEDFDFIIWADADVAFMDSSNDLLQLLKPDYFMAAYKQNNWKTWDYLCNGLIVLRNNQQARDYIKEWIRRIDTKFIKDHPWEQWYFDEIIRETNWENVRCCTAQEIGCFCPQVWHDGIIWQEGMPTIHLAGQGMDATTKQKIFIAHYQGLVK